MIELRRSGGRGVHLGGTWVGTGAPEPRRDRWTGEVIASLATGGAAEATLAVDAADAVDAEAFPAQARAALLAGLSAAVEAHAEELAACITAETGKPITAARTEVARAVGTFAACAEEARRLPGERVPLEAGGAGAGVLAVTIPQPRGIVAAITPFNFPINLVAHKIGPALAAGCPVVLKPSDKAPLVAVRLLELAQECGLPDGWLNLVHGAAEPIVGAWLADERVAVVDFTGSATVGWDLKARSPRKLHILELGSATALYVHRSADLAAAADAIVAAGYANSGQACISLQRLYVDEVVADPLLEAVVDRLGGVGAGDPNDPATVVGPLITDAAVERVEGVIAGALRSGARRLSGGPTVDGVIPPTLLAGVDDDAAAIRDEVFGPVVSAVAVDGLDDALRRVNSSRFGLNISIFARDLGTALAFSRRAEAGTVLVNMPPSFRDDRMPYGGVKESGQGREGVRYAIAELLEMKLVILNA